MPVPLSGGRIITSNCFPRSAITRYAGSGPRKAKHRCPRHGNIRFRQVRHINIRLNPNRIVVFIRGVVIPNAFHIPTRDTPLKSSTSHPKPGHTAHIVRAVVQTPEFEADNGYRTRCALPRIQRKRADIGTCLVIDKEFFRAGVQTRSRFILRNITTHLLHRCWRRAYHKYPGTSTPIASIAIPIPFIIVQVLLPTSSSILSNHRIPSPAGICHC